MDLVVLWLDWNFRFRICKLIDFCLFFGKNVGYKQIFWLDHQSGKKCYKISPSELTIVWACGDTPRCWGWISFLEAKYLFISNSYQSYCFCIFFSNLL